MTFQEALELEKGTIVYEVERLKVSDDNAVLDSDTQCDEDHFFLSKEEAKDLVDYYLDHNWLNEGYNLIALSKNVVSDDGLDEIDSEDFEIKEED